MILDQLEAPIVLAPLAGGPSTPELVAAVSEAGGIGFLPFGYLDPQAAQEQLGATRALTARPFGVNVFAPGDGPTAPAVYGPYVNRLAEWARRLDLPLGTPRYSDDSFDEKIELLVSDPVPLVSFTFGAPPSRAVQRLRSVGSEIWVTVTTPSEAARATAAGADALIVQGSEAGGHRSSFTDSDAAPLYGVLALLQLIRAQEKSMPLVASGGIATGGALAAVLTAGASAAQVGSAFMLCPEAGTAPAHRDALRSGQETALTRAFTGRLARGIRNAFMSEHDEAAPVAYPEIHFVTAPLRKAARERGEASLMHLWAGEAHGLARDAPAAEVVDGLMSEARAAIATGSEKLEAPGR
jgi:nitronate monooxygenase